MRAIELTKPGGPEVMTVKDREKPQPRKGELLVEVKAAGVNRTDTLTRMNTNLQAPYPILGIEVSGVVVENQAGEEQFNPGTRVAGLVNHGGYAEYAILPADRAIRLPEQMSFEEGAAIPEVFLTAYQTLYWLGELQEEETVLVHAGASGVGTAAIQLAKQLSKARIITTAGSQEKLAVCKDLGADVTINYKEEDFSEKVLDVTNQAGVNLILDFVGASYWEKNLKSIGMEGRWIVIGTLGGNTIPEMKLSDLMQKRLTLKGTVLTPRSDEYKARLTQDFSTRAFPYFESGKIRPIVDTIFALDEAANAHRHMEANKNIGKILLKP